MPPKYDLISDIHAKHGNWSIVVGVVRMWQVPDLNNSRIPYCIECVLLDTEGNKIHASIKKSLIYRFENDLKEGFVYHMSNFGVAANIGAYRPTRHEFKLNFQYTTKIKKLDNVVVPMNEFTFTSPADCFKPNFDMNYLVDFIGVLTGVGKETEYEKNGVKTRKMVMELDNNGYRFQITLFGTYADELNSFISSGESSNAIVAVLFVKCKDFGGKPVLQNSIRSSKLLFNPSNSVADSLRKRLADNHESPNVVLSQLQDSPKIEMEDDFLNLTPMKTIEDLKEYKEAGLFIILGKVNCIVDEEHWWYTACRCSKKVYPDSNMYFCEKCNRHVVNVVQRFRLQLRVIDHTESATFVLFDREASFLLKSSCAELIEAVNLSPDPGSLPAVISELVDKEFLFKVECSPDSGSRYEKSYRVKRVCTDAVIIEKFNNKYTTEDHARIEDEIQGSELNSVEVVLTGDVSQDLLKKFSESEDDKAIKGNVTEVVDLCSDVQQSPEITKPCPFADNEILLSNGVVLKKQIKIEKE